MTAAIAAGRYRIFPFIPPFLPWAPISATYTAFDRTLSY